MYEREYKIANDIAKKKLLKILNEKFKEKYNMEDRHILERCYKEIELLYEKQDLFIVYILYLMKVNYSYKYKIYFKDTLNNLLILYILELNEINPIKYGLSYELYNESEIAVYIDGDYTNFFPIEAFENIIFNVFNEDLDPFTSEEYNPIYFELIHGYFDKSHRKEIDLDNEHHYLIVPRVRNNEFLLRLDDDGIIETATDYHNYEGKIKWVAIHCEYRFHGIFVDDNEHFIDNLRDKLKPKTKEDYIKIISLNNGTFIWDTNKAVWNKCQAILYSKVMVRLNKSIFNREDLFEYLVEHNLDRNLALEITNFVGEGKAFSDVDSINNCKIDKIKQLCLNTKKIEQWENYKNIIKEHNCEDWLIDACSNVIYLSAKGKSVMECILLKEYGKLIC